MLETPYYPPRSWWEFQYGRLIKEKCRAEAIALILASSK
jgi:hypothetical protein